MNDGVSAIPIVAWRPGRTPDRLRAVLGRAAGPSPEVVAGLRDAPRVEGRATARVATKYPRTTTRFFHARGLPVEVITLSGSVELAPVLGLAEHIVDVVETGRTLEENGLVVLEDVARVGPAGREPRRLAAPGARAPGPRGGPPGGAARRRSLTRPAAGRRLLC